MSRFPLALRPCDRFIESSSHTPLLPSAAAPVTSDPAWFLPGSEPEAWLEELARWRVPLDSVTLRMVPRSLSDRQACGVLVVLPNDQSCVPSPWVIPCTSRIGRLFFPTNSRLHPDPTDAELERELLDRVYFLHPTIGFVGFGPEDEWRVEQLLLKPARRSSTWRELDPGVRLAPRLREVTAIAGRSPEDVLESGREEIATEGPEDLPPAPDEPRDSLKGKLRDLGSSGLTKFARWLAGRSSPTPASGEVSTGSSWLDRLDTWAQRRSEQSEYEREVRRHREVFRLLHLLETEPDEGLRHALPLESLNARGLVPPGTGLEAREVDFDLEALRGGSPASSWSISAEIYERLLGSYRQLANRELHLGRHRRAAYIFAQLLGEYREAASALRQGEHFHEAGVLYLTKLDLPREAARCFEDAGEWEQAVQLYEKSECFEEAGDLLTRLEMFPRASFTYRKAAELLLERQDRVGAARVFEAKIGRPREALAVLTLGWPHTEQAQQCLAQGFVLMAREGWHDDARQSLNDLVSTRFEGHEELGASALEVMSEVARAYPEADVAEAAADGARVVAATVLQASTEQLATGPVERAVRALASLAPGDVILSRDADRFRARVRARRQAQVRKAPAPAARRKRAVRIVGEIELPSEVSWRAACATTAGIIAVGAAGATLVAVRVDFEGRAIDRLEWEGVGYGAEPCVDAHWDTPSLVLVHVPHRTVEPQVWSPTDRFPLPIKVGSPSWLASSTVGFAVGTAGMIWSVRAEREGHTLCAHTSDGTLRETHALPLLDSEGGAPSSGSSRVTVHARPQAVFVGVGHTLLRLGAEREWIVNPLLDEVRAVTGSAPFTVPRVAAALPQGGVLVWAGLGWSHQYPFALGLSDPVVTMLRDGRLIAVTAAQGQVFDTGEQRVTLSAEFEGPGDEPIGVFRAAGTSEFVVVTRAGRSLRYRMESLG